MNATRRRTNIPAARKKVILVFGEDTHDTTSIKELLLAANPSLDGMIKPMRRPPILLRDCRLEDVAARVATIADVIDAERSTAEVIAVLAHEDCDNVEPAHERLASKIEEAFQQRDTWFTR